MLMLCCGSAEFQADALPTQELCLWQIAQGAFQPAHRSVKRLLWAASANGKKMHLLVVQLGCEQPLVPRCAAQRFTQQGIGQPQPVTALPLTLLQVAQSWCYPVLCLPRCGSWVEVAASARRSPAHFILQPVHLWLPMCLCHAPQVYVTGHGGEDFLKFQDKGEMQSSELADAIHLVRCNFLNPAHHASRVTWMPIVWGLKRREGKHSPMCMHAVPVKGTGHL